ncbi:mutator type transposase [Tanacetum coccineum]
MVFMIVILTRCTIKLESTLFSIKLHYGGVFTKSPNRKYINGNITFVDMIDSDEFSVHEIDSMLEDLGQDGHRVMFYHFLKPGCDLDNGLEPIACDRDVVVLGNYVTQGLKLVEVFVEHEKTNPDIYTPPKAKRIVIEELDAEPIISKAGITPVARKIVLDVTNNQTCGKEKGKSSGKDLEGQSSGKDLEGQSSAVGNDGSYEESQDPNFDPFADLDLILPTIGDWEGNTSEHVDLGDETNNVETECNDDERHRVEETQGDDDRHGEEQTGGDHEIHDEEEREGDDESDSQDSDYIVDSDNNVDDIDVDMADFEYNIDEDVEFGGCRDREEVANVEEEDAEELEVLDNDYFESASDTDDENSRFMKRKQAHATEQVYKTYFYVGKEFTSKEEVRSYIKEHSIETRREIRMEKNDNERIRAVCRGLTKEKLIVGGKPNSKKKVDDNKCPWVVLVSKIKNKETWQYAKDLVEQLKTNPTIPVRAVQEQLQQIHELNVTQSKAFRAKQAAETKLMGDYALQYKMLRDYVLELQESNEATKYTVAEVMDGLYQVSGPWNDQVVVNVVARTCTCRIWELTGIPCKHVVATNWVMSLNNEAGIPEEWVHPCYRSAPATDKRRGTSQSKKATIATRSSTAKDKGKAPTTSGGVAKKTTPMTKIVNLG